MDARVKPGQDECVCGFIHKHSFAFSRHDLPELCTDILPRRGSRECRVRAAPKRTSANHFELIGSRPGGNDRVSAEGSTIQQSGLHPRGMLRTVALRGDQHVHGSLRASALANSELCRATGAAAVQAEKLPCLTHLPRRPPRRFARLSLISINLPSKSWPTRRCRALRSPWCRMARLH
jgi:hypothetical protein